MIICEKVDSGNYRRRYNTSCVELFLKCCPLVGAILSDVSENKTSAARVLTATQVSDGRKLTTSDNPDGFPSSALAGPFHVHPPGLRV